MSTRRVSMSQPHCYMQAPADQQHRVISRQPSLPKTEIVRDEEGWLVVPRKTPTLIERLIARSAGQTLATPKKRGRGRPKKGGAA